MATLYSLTTNGSITLATATPKTIMSLVNWANGTFRIVEMGISFKGTVATAEPVVVELMQSSETGAGSSTAHTTARIAGAERSPQVTAKYNFTSEPTDLTDIARWLVHPQAGIVIQWPLGREPECLTTQDALIIRCTAPSSVGVEGYLWWEE